MTIPKFTKSTCPKCGNPTNTVSGAWLRERRKVAGKTLRDMGDITGYSFPFLCDVELGRRKCSEKVLVAYEALSVKKGGVR